MYEVKAVPTTIKATSKCTVKVRDNYYSIEYTEERALPNFDDVDMEMERVHLFEDCNEIVDKQINDILDSFKK